MIQTFVQPKLPFLVNYSCWLPILVTLLFPLETSEGEECRLLAVYVARSTSGDQKKKLDIMNKK